MEIMNARSIRHLPVKDSEGRVLGLISIRDVVKEVISTKEVCLRTTHLSRVVKVGQRTKEAQALDKLNPVWIPRIAPLVTLPHYTLLYRR
jgi:CBS domain-containing protein